MHIIRSFFDFKQKINYKNEILAGLAVAMTMIPESLSFAILAGLSPLTGLYAALLMGLVTAVLGGRPGMISGGAGATVVVLIALVAIHGVEYLFAAVILAGILQFLVGVFKWGKLVSLIPQPVVYGFLNGLAIIIFMSQVGQFKVIENGVEGWMQGRSLYLMIGLTLLTVLIVYLFPKFTKAIPASLVAIIFIFCVVNFLNIETKKVIDIASVGGALPSFNIPRVPFDIHTLKIIFPYALVMAAVGLIESLLTMNVVDDLTQSKGKPNREARAQGIANITNGFLGGMGGCAMIAQTLVNIRAGGRTRLSALVASIAILIVIIVASPLIEQIPMAALVGVMMVVAISTFEWASVRMINKMPKHDIFIGILVAAITVLSKNLALAVLIGVIISALIYAWKSAQNMHIKSYISEDGIKYYSVVGPLFFGSVTAFLDQIDILDDPAKIVIDFKNSKIVDMSAIDALHKITEKYHLEGKKVMISNLSPHCKELLNNAKNLMEVNFIEQEIKS